MEEPQKQEEGKYRSHLFKPGVSGNPKGRPKGSVSLKTYIAKKLKELDEWEKEAFLDGLDKKVLWEMAEGKPKQDVQADVEITSKVISVDE